MSATVTRTKLVKEQRQIPESNNVNDQKDKSKIYIRAIKKVILEEEKRVRKEHSWINYQNTIGTFFFLSSLIAIVQIASSYLSGSLPWYFTIPLMGLPISILHELEHDLIHNLYFKGNKLIQNIMFGTIWFLKFHGNPWWRRDMHHWHHRVSGQTNDIEERLIGLGMKLDAKRLGVTTHPLGFLNDIKEIKSGAPKTFDIKYMNQGSMPTAVILILFLKAFPWVFAAKLLLVPTETWDYYGLDIIFNPVRDFMVILAFPLFLRQSCLVAMSTGCHYYGDIPKRNCYYQNQILDHWLLTPLQVYCWWFGSTHIMHHYIPNQPFYMRPFLQKKVHETMVNYGVRKNDWGIILRANRYNRKVEDAEKEKLSAIIWFSLVVVGSFFYCFIWDFFVAKSGFKVVTWFFLYPFYCNTEKYRLYKEKQLLEDKKAGFTGVPHVNTDTIEVEE